MIDNNQFYLRLAQKIVSIFSINTSAGVLYEADMRLRPSSDAGLIGCSLSTFSHYQLNDAWTWEKQALVRARPIFGESSLKAKFEHIRQQVLSASRDIEQLKQDVVEMRKKCLPIYLTQNTVNLTLKQIAVVSLILNLSLNI